MMREEAKMNKVVLMGRLTRDPDIRTSQGEKATTIARYTLAVKRRATKEGEASADFISCVVFGKGAEFAEKYLHQGSRIALSGRIQTGSYTNREGQKVYTTDVIVEEQEFAETRAEAKNRPEPKKQDEDGFMEIPDGVEDEGLPFA